MPVELGLPTRSPARLKYSQRDKCGKQRSRDKGKNQDPRRSHISTYTSPRSASAQSQVERSREESERRRHGGSTGCCRKRSSRQRTCRAIIAPRQRRVKELECTPWTRPARTLWLRPARRRGCGSLPRGSACRWSCGKGSRCGTSTSATADAPCWRGLERPETTCRHTFRVTGHYHLPAERWYNRARAADCEPRVAAHDQAV